MISVEKLTAPISESAPCGEDLSIGTSLLELDALILGKLSTQFGEAEPPDWRTVQQTCLDLFGRSLDLRVSVALCLALTCTTGLEGLRDGLAVLRALLEKYWGPVHPKLDPEDNNDPLQRINTIAVLAAPVGKDGDPFRFIEHLQEVPLINSRQIGKFSFGALEEARLAAASGTSAKSEIDADQIEAAFRDTPEEEVRLTFIHAGEALEHLRAIGKFLSSAVGAQQAPNLSELEKALVAIQRLVAPHVKSDTSLPAGADAPALTDGERSAGGNNRGGPISNREDVLRMLAQIRAFYAKHEPASPIPLLIHRVERMVPMSFLEILNEMAPDSVNQISNIVGPQS